VTAAGTDVFVDPTVDDLFAKRGYYETPLLDEGQIADLVTLHDRLVPSVSSGFEASVLSDSGEFRERVSDGIRELVEAPLSELLPHHKLVLAVFVTKPANSRGGTLPLHQDWWIVDNRACRGLHVWCPLVDVDSSNGCLKVVPGVHRLLNEPYPINGKYRTGYHASLSRLETEYARHVPQPRGSALVYDQRMLHGSDENASPAVRIAFNCIMIPKNVQPSIYWWDEETPSTMQRFQVPERYLCHFRFGNAIEKPYPPGVELIESFEARVNPLRETDFLALSAHDGAVTG